MRLRRQVPPIFIGAAAILIGAATAIAVTAIPVLWTAGGLDAGTTGAGQAARMAADGMGNVAIVSGPAVGRDLAVTSYASDGTFRWRRTISPAAGTFTGDWVASSPDGDVVAVGHNVTSGGSPIGLTIVRYASDGTLQSRVDLTGIRPGVGRLLVDAAGDAYLAFNSLGDGQDIRLNKYNPAGVLMWSQVISTGFVANDVATSLALGPDGADVVLTGNIVGGATWITAAYNTVTGGRRWLVTAAEGLAARDVVVDATRVYVTGQGVTGAGTPALAYWLTVVAYDRATGARLWRRDVKPADAGDAAGLRMALAPDGSLVVTGQANRGFLDWYTVAFENNGALRWQAVRDGGLNTNEIPAAVLVLPDGTTVVTGPGGPNLPGGFIPGVTAGYGTDGALLWEAFSRMATVWGAALINGDVCATGGYDALITCWRPSGTVPNVPPTLVMSATPSSGAAPLAVSFDGSASSDADGAVTSWAWSFGDGAFGTGARTTHVYAVPGTYTASLTIMDNSGASSTSALPVVVNGVPPQAPTGLGAEAIARRSIGLNWTNGTIAQTGVRIERCTGSGCTNFAQVGSVAGTATSFIDESLARRTTYTYRVRAFNAYGNSPYSNTASARTSR
jgi:PKD repeat protein